MFSIFAIALVSYVAYYLHNLKKSEFQNQIYSKIDRIFDGKTVILDGQNSLAVGKLRETGYNPNVTKEEGDDALARIFAEWWEREKLYSIFEATSGGFTIKQLTRQNENGFDIETIYSGNMGYKKPTRYYVQPDYFDWGFGEQQMVRNGYWTESNRLSVRECYLEAFKYFTEEDKKVPGAYSPGKFIDITNFPDIRNKYFFMENTGPRQFSSSGVFSAEWESGDHSANVNTEDWAVYYKLYGKHYELTENKDAMTKDLLKNLSIAVGPVILLLLILLLSNPRFFRNLSLFGKRWENKAYSDQILFFEHSLMGQNKFIEIINDKVSKGILKITGNGTTLNLSYPNKELFYNIYEIQEDKLILVSQKDNSHIEFSRVGSVEKESK